MAFFFFHDNCNSVLVIPLDLHYISSQLESFLKHVQEKGMRNEVLQEAGHDQKQMHNYHYL